jgi:hypothetical protein
MAAAAAAWHQHGISNGGTINNQLKALAATALEMAMMTATMTTIKMKAIERKPERLGIGNES